MINPFISIDYQLEQAGWNKYSDNRAGFIFTKKIGNDLALVAECRASQGGKIRFLYSEERDGSFIEEKDLYLFAKKLKEWRWKNEHPNKGGRHYSKKRR